MEFDTTCVASKTEKTDRIIENLLLDGAIYDEHEQN